MNQQLALAIQFNHRETLTDFFWGENQLLKQSLEQTLEKKGEQFIYLWGTPGSGKSHLLQGCCQYLDNQQPSAYLPLSILEPWGPSSIEGFGQQRLIAIDDIDSIAGDKAWEEALFHLFNRVRDNGQTILLISAQKAPANSSILLPDLRSRLGWGLVFHLAELSDELKIKVLQQAATKRGFTLPDQAALFLIKRCARNMHTLNQLLNRLDEASLVLQRKITVPFIKTILDL